MENDYRLVRDLEEYVRFRAKEKRDWDLLLRDMITKMDDDGSAVPTIIMVNYWKLIFAPKNV